MRNVSRILVLFLITTCYGCGPRAPLEAAQRLVPDYGFHLVAQTGGEVQVYPHALYYSGSGHAAVALSYRGQPIYELEIEPGGEQFRLLTVDGGVVRLLAVTCPLAHELGYFSWIPCAASAHDGTPAPAARVLVEYEPATGKTTTMFPSMCGSCPVDDAGKCCCPDVTTGYTCPQ